MNLNNHTYEAFPERLKRLLGESETTMTDFAKKIGKSQPTVTKYISGAKSPTVAVLVKMADCLDVTVDYLLCRKCAALTLQSTKDNIYIFEKLEFDFNLLTKEYDRYLTSILGTGDWTEASSETVSFITMLLTAHLRDTVNVFKNRHGFPKEECRAYLTRSEELHKIVNYFMYRMAHDTISSFSPGAKAPVFRLDVEASILELIKLFNRRSEKLGDIFLDNLLLTIEHAAGQ